MKVLVTGSSGYIASSLIPELVGEGHRVKGLDLVESQEKLCEFTQGDIRDIDFMGNQIAGMDVVIHLAAVVPPSHLDPQMEDINFKGTNRLAQLCRAKGVPSFLFSSTCSVYGGGKDLTEWSMFQSSLTNHAPETPYVSGKIRTESFVLSIRTKIFNPIVFRFATVFGVGGKVGWQSLFNSFVKEAKENGELKIKHPNAYRPFCHVKDIAKGVVLVLKNPIDITSGQVYNVGGVNATKLELIGLIKEQVPNLNVVNLGGNDNGYSVNFERMEGMGFKTTKDLKDGVKEVFEYLCR